MYWCKLLIINALCMMIGCGVVKKNDIPVYKLTDGLPERVLNMSELVDSLRIVRLETTEEGLVPGYSNVWCGDKYILILGNTVILQFTADGKYIRQLVKQGRAPGEFTALSGFVVDEKQEKFYFCDWSGRLSEYNMLDGTFIGSVHLDYVMTNALLMDDGTITYIPYISLDDTSNYDLCRITQDGKLVDGVKSPEFTGRDYTSNNYLGVLGGEVHFMGSYADMLYRICDTAKTPILALDIPKRFSKEKGMGDVPKICFENSHLLLAEISETEVKDVEGGRYVNMRNKRTFLIDKKVGTVEKMKWFCVDTLKYRIHFEPVVCGRRLCLQLPAMRLRRWLEIAKTDEKSSPAEQERFARLYEEITDDDNPVLVIGNIR